MNNSTQRVGALTEKIRLEQAVSHDIMLGAPAPYDMVDDSGHLLLAKGLPVTRTALKMLKKRQIYVISREYLPHQSFSYSLHSRAVTILERLYHHEPIRNSGQLQEVMEVVDSLLAELEQKPRLYLDLHYLKDHDDFTYVHSVNVAILAALIGQGMGFTRQALRWLTMGAILHDIGKIKIPREILYKQGGLTEAEYSLIRHHPWWGEEILSSVGLPLTVLAVVHHHHERWDGRGYPAQLAQGCIPINAQITAVADVFEAITADRPYHKGMPAHHAVELIVSGEGTDFSPQIVRSFLDHVTLFPPNALVTLNTGERGVVMDVPRRFPTRPRIRILYDERGERCSEYEIDMLVKLDVYIATLDYDHR